MPTKDDTLALCDDILDTLAFENEPTTRWRRIPCDDEQSTQVFLRQLHTKSGEVR